MAKIFIPLWSKTKGDTSKVKDVLAEMGKAIPDDKKFKDGVCTAPLYKMPRISHFLLLKYEEYLQSKEFEVYPNQHINTIDHINPQDHKLKGKKAEEYEETLHLWGNLLPMSQRLNASKGNKKTFTEIKKILNINAKFETTIKFLNQNKNKKTWTPKDIRDRTKKIADWAVKEWKA